MKKKYTNIEINNACDSIIDDLKQARTHKHSCFLCDEFRTYFNVYKDDIITIIPEFTIENAIKYANARYPSNESFDLGWWDGFKQGDKFNYKDRIKFVKWIKKQYPITPEENITPEE